MNLEDLRYETFRDRTGESFRDTEAGIILELLQVDDLTAVARNVPPDARAPFSLVFRGPAEPALSQGIRRLEHDELGTTEIFIVPIALEADGLRYQAVFS